MIRRKLVPLCMAAMMMCSSLSVNAAESQSFSSADIGESTTGKSEVLYSQDSDFTVTIPKKIALGTAKTAQYDVSVKGSVRADESVTVKPDETFSMNETAGRKAAVTATITQADTAWSCAEITDAGTVKSGSVTAAGLTAGDWSGELVFHINMETQAAELPEAVLTLNDSISGGSFADTQALKTNWLRYEKARFRVSSDSTGAITVESSAPGVAEVVSDSMFLPDGYKITAKSAGNAVITIKQEADATHAAVAKEIAVSVEEHVCKDIEYNAWTGDSELHYGACKECGSEVDGYSGPHTYNDDGVCTVCRRSIG